MPVHFLRALRRVLIVTTTFPILWFLVAGLSVVGGVRIHGLEHPWLLALAYGMFWATPPLALVGLILGLVQRTNGRPLPRLYLTLIVASAVIWLGLMGLISLFPN